MMYTVIYVDKDGIRRWKKANNIDDAELFGRENSKSYDVCVSLYDYDRLKHENTILKAQLKKIEQIAKGGK